MTTTRTFYAEVLAAGDDTQWIALPRAVSGSADIVAEWLHENGLPSERFPQARVVERRVEMTFHVERSMRFMGSTDQQIVDAAQKWAEGDRK